MRNIIIIGLGGIGSHLAAPLNRYLISLGEEKASEFRIRFVDGDKYEGGNIGRQDFALILIGMKKAEAQAKIFAARFPDNPVMIEAIGEYIGESNVAEIIPEDSIVFSCVDNHTCRHIVSKHCQTLNNVLLISGGNDYFDGNVQGFCRKDGKSLNETIESRHKEIATTQDGDRASMSCEELALLPSGGQVIITNFTVAAIMLNLFFSYLNNEGDPSNVTEIFFDIRGCKYRTVRKEA